MPDVYYKNTRLLSDFKSDGQLKPFYQLQIGGWYHLQDLFYQLHYSLANCNFPRKEPPLKYILDFQLSKNGIDSNFTNLMRTSTILLGWSILEAYANFLAEIIIAINEEMDGSPKYVSKISTIEYDFLKEQQTIFNAKKGEIQIKKGHFATTLDKISIIPSLLGQVRGIDFKIDRGSRSWQCIQSTKELRDNLTHPRINYPIIGKVLESNIFLEEAIKMSPVEIPNFIDAKAIFNLFTGLAWFFSSTYYLVESKLAGISLSASTMLFFEGCRLIGKDINNISKEYVIEFNIEMSDDTPPFLC